MHVGRKFTSTLNSIQVEWSGSKVDREGWKKKVRDQQILPLIKAENIKVEQSRYLLVVVGCVCVLVCEKRGCLLLHAYKLKYIHLTRKHIASEAARMWHRFIYSLLTRSSTSSPCTPPLSLSLHLWPC